MIRDGRTAAFEAVYDRHHRSILSFCRHMLANADEAEDAVQHTFLAAYSDIINTDKPISLRAWLFTIARNRCYSVLRSRREQPTEALAEPATEGLATQVQRRQDLRDLVSDLQRLPQEQRAALVLAEMDALSHDQIGVVLGVPRDKVKSLVFQARESLLASRAARDTDCSEIRRQLATLHGGALRRTHLRRHLRECAGCREYRAQIDHQRKRLRVILPVAPTLALKEAVLATTVGGAGLGLAGGGGVLASSALKGAVLKTAIGATLAGVGAVGTVASGVLPLTVHQQAQAQPAVPPPLAAHSSSDRDESAVASSARAAGTEAIPLRNLRASGLAESAFPSARAARAHRHVTDTQVFVIPAVRRRFAVVPRTIPYPIASSYGAGVGVSVSTPGNAGNGRGHGWGRIRSHGQAARHNGGAWPTATRTGPAAGADRSNARAHGVGRSGTKGSAAGGHGNGNGRGLGHGAGGYKKQLPAPSTGQAGARGLG
jgi:RNA polymerase sigma factor (sigma-70 family)